MRHYGEVKWYGGFNNKTQKVNEFGYITILGEKELRNKDTYFNKSEVLFDKNLVKEGLLVSFELSVCFLQELFPESCK